MPTANALPVAPIAAATVPPRRRRRGRIAGVATGLAALLVLAAALPTDAWAQHRGGWRPGGYHGGWGGWRGGVYWGLPAWATVLTVGAVTYWVVDGVYYRALPSGGYEPVAVPAGAPALPALPAGGAAPVDRLYIYPGKGQSAERQASDEYECHRWAATQSGFDPVGQASGTAPAPAADDAAAAPAPAVPDARAMAGYRRAQAACLEGRGYTVR